METGGAACLFLRSLEGHGFYCFKEEKEGLPDGGKYGYGSYAGRAENG